VVELPARLRAAGSLEGLKDVDTVIIHSIDLDKFKTLGYERYRNLLVKQLGVDERFTAVLMTGAKLSSMAIAASEDVLAVTTVGLGEASCIDSTPVETPGPSTINVFVYSSVELTEAGLLDLYRTTVEAKTMAASFLPLYCPKLRPMGTPSDAVLVAAPVSREGTSWCGVATKCGTRVVRLVVEAVLRASPKLAVEDPLKPLGVTTKDIVEDIMKLDELGPVRSRLASQAPRLLKRIVSDINVALQLIAAKELDAHLDAYTMSRRPVRDPHWLIADELLGSALAVYVAGFKSLLSTYWVERLKAERQLKLDTLPPFSDDVVSALVGSILTLSCEAEARGERSCQLEW
jgi:alpha-ribazole phosphatase CobZ